MVRDIKLPDDIGVISSLVMGDMVLLSGKIYTARDAAHKRLYELLKKGAKLPIDLRNQILYYCGPTPPKENEVIGSAGPTTSSRMDKYTPELISASGLIGIIGKGNRSKEVVDAFVKHKCTYFAATGGAGALLGKKIKKSRIVCYEDLGPEAIYEFEVEEFPLIVAIDTSGRNIYIEGPSKWKELK